MQLRGEVSGIEVNIGEVRTWPGEVLRGEVRFALCLYEPPNRELTCTCV